MAYVRKKKVDGREYHQLVESYREDGKVRQRVLAHLGRYATVDEALDGLPRQIGFRLRGAELNRRPGRWRRGPSPSSLERAASNERGADSLRARLDRLRLLRQQGKA